MTRPKPFEPSYVDPAVNALYSAKYILEDLNNDGGISALAELTGLPDGVIAAAMKAIFFEQ